jgi:archaellum component FlaC
MPPAPGYAPYNPQMSREDELNYMKDQAEAIKGQLQEIESRIRDLETEK